jgi:hypothetical protein
MMNQERSRATAGACPRQVGHSSVVGAGQVDEGGRRVGVGADVVEAELAEAAFAVLVAGGRHADHGEPGGGEPGEGVVVEPAGAGGDDGRLGLARALGNRPGAGLCLGPHFYTSDDECDAVLAEVAILRTTAEAARRPWVARIVAPIMARCRANRALRQRWAVGACSWSGPSDKRSSGSWSTPSTG